MLKLACVVSNYSVSRQIILSQNYTLRTVKHSLQIKHIGFALTAINALLDYYLHA